MLQSGSQANVPCSPLPSTSVSREKSDSEEEAVIRASSPKVSGDEDKGDADRRSFRYKSSLEEMDDLIKTIHTTLSIQEDKVD